MSMDTCVVCELCAYICFSICEEERQKSQTETQMEKQQLQNKMIKFRSSNGTYSYVQFHDLTWCLCFPKCLLIFLRGFQPNGRVCMTELFAVSYLVFFCDKTIFALITESTWTICGSSVADNSGGGLIVDLCMYMYVCMYVWSYARIQYVHMQYARACDWKVSTCVCARVHASAITCAKVT
jgi:hypothetical protein